MLAFILRRLLLTLPVIWIVITLVFGLIHMVPGDPVAQIVAWTGPVDDSGDQRPRLSARAGLHSDDLVDIYFDQSGHGRPVFGRGAAYPVMTEFLRKNKLAAAGLSIVVVLTVAALFAPWLAPYDPADQKLIDRLEGPSWKHPFGNDELGRDILSRILLGTRVSMRVGATVVLLSGIIGVLIGGFAGYIGGKVDTFVTVAVINSLLAFPGILFAIALVAFLGPGLDRLIFALVIIGWVGYARLARGQVLKVKTLEFVEAARALGASSVRIFVSHVLPTIMVFPSIALVLTVLSLNFLGDALQDWLHPKSLG